MYRYRDRGLHEDEGAYDNEAGNDSKAGYDNEADHNDAASYDVRDYEEDDYAEDMHASDEYDGDDAEESDYEEDAERIEEFRSRVKHSEAVSGRASKDSKTQSKAGSKPRSIRYDEYETENSSVKKKSSEKDNSTKHGYSDIDKARFVIAMFGVLVCLALVIVAWNMGKKHVALEEYVNISYRGANGYAYAECSVDADKLVQELTDNDKDTANSQAYIRFANSIAAVITDGSYSDKGISNGDKLEIYVTYDRDLAKSAGLSVSNGTFNVRAKGIEDGKKIDLFENAEVVFAGISPDAYVVVKNNWEDEFLSEMSYEADKTGGITVGDDVTVTCTVDEVELGRHGYVTDGCTNVYNAGKLSSYVNTADQIDKNVLEKLKSDCRATIISETADTTFRMMYKATGDKSYLHVTNDETADNITFIEAKLLKRKSATDAINPDNRIVLLFAADITCNGTAETVYFEFTFDNGYITWENEFNVAYSSLKEIYECNTDLDTFADETDIYTIIYIV